MSSYSLMCTVSASVRFNNWSQPAIETQPGSKATHSTQLTFYKFCFSGFNHLHDDEECNVTKLLFLTSFIHLQSFKWTCAQNHRQWGQLRMHLSKATKAFSLVATEM